MEVNWVVFDKECVSGSTNSDTETEVNADNKISK